MRTRKTELEPEGLYAPQARHTFTWGVNTVAVVGADISDVVFSHEDPYIQTVNITKIKEATKLGKVRFKKIMAMFDYDNVQAMLKDRDIDPKRVEYILARPEIYDEPAIFVGKVPDVTLIDGTHRMYARYHNKEEGMRAYIITYFQLQRFRVQFWVNGVLIKDTRDSIMKTFQHTKTEGATG